MFLRNYDPTRMTSWRPRTVVALCAESAIGVETRLECFVSFAAKPRWDRYAAFPWIKFRLRCSALLPTQRKYNEGIEERARESYLSGVSTLCYGAPKDMLHEEVGRLQGILKNIQLIAETQLYYDMLTILFIETLRIKANVYFKRLNTISIALKN